MDYSRPGSSIHEILQARLLDGLLFPSPGDLPDPEIEPGSPALQADPLPSELPGKPYGTPIQQAIIASSCKHKRAGTFSLALHKS